MAIAGSLRGLAAALRGVCSALWRGRRAPLARAPSFGRRFGSRFLAARDTREARDEHARLERAHLDRALAGWDDDGGASKGGSDATIR